jgi:hypothetical protein
MTSRKDSARLQEELTDALRWGDETRARTLLPQLGANPRQVRTVLESMLSAPDALARQAAAFGLGELGGASSARRLEQQLALEEARGDHDGASVADAITRALGRIEEAGARASLVRRLSRLVAQGASPADVNALARALWRRRHPDLIPAVREAMGQLAASKPSSLHGLLLLLEKSPEQLDAWARDLAVPVEHKTEVLTVLEEEVPEALVAALPSFISAALGRAESASTKDAEDAYYCERLLRLLLLHSERLLPTLPEAAHSGLHALARSLIPAPSPNCVFQAMALLRLIGGPEDASLIEAHRPEDATGARAFDEAAAALRSPQKH